MINEVGNGPNAICFPLIFMNFLSQLIIFIQRSIHLLIVMVFKNKALNEGQIRSRREKTS